MMIRSNWIRFVFTCAVSLVSLATLCRLNDVRSAKLKFKRQIMKVSIPDVRDYVLKNIETFHMRQLSHILRACCIVGFIMRELLQSDIERELARFWILLARVQLNTDADDTIMSKKTTTIRSKINKVTLHENLEDDGYTDDEGLSDAEMAQMALPDTFEPLVNIEMMTTMNDSLPDVTPDRLAASAMYQMQMMETENLALAFDSEFAIPAPKVSPEDALFGGPPSMIDLTSPSKQETDTDMDFLVSKARPQAFVSRQTSLTNNNTPRQQHHQQQRRNKSKSKSKSPYGGLYNKPIYQHHSRSRSPDPEPYSSMSGVEPLEYNSDEGSVNNDEQSPPQEEAPFALHRSNVMKHNQANNIHTNPSTRAIIQSSTSPRSVTSTMIDGQSMKTITSPERSHIDSGAVLYDNEGQALSPISKSQTANQQVNPKKKLKVDRYIDQTVDLAADANCTSRLVVNTEKRILSNIAPALRHYLDQTTQTHRTKTKNKKGEIPHVWSSLATTGSRLNQKRVCSNQDRTVTLAQKHLARFADVWNKYKEKMPPLSPNLSPKFSQASFSPQNHNDNDDDDNDNEDDNDNNNDNGNDNDNFDHDGGNVDGQGYDSDSPEHAKGLTTMEAIEMGRDRASRSRVPRFSPSSFDSSLEESFEETRVAALPWSTPHMSELTINESLFAQDKDGAIERDSDLQSNATEFESVNSDGLELQSSPKSTSSSRGGMSLALKQFYWHLVKDVDENHETYMHDIVPHKSSRTAAACGLSNILTLAGRSLVELSQQQAYGPILVRVNHTADDHSAKSDAESNDERVHDGDVEDETDGQDVHDDDVNDGVKDGSVNDNNDIDDDDLLDDHDTHDNIGVGAFDKDDDDVDDKDGDDGDDKDDDDVDDKNDDDVDDDKDNDDVDDKDDDIVDDKDDDDIDDDVDDGVDDTDGDDVDDKDDDDVNDKDDDEVDNKDDDDVDDKDDDDVDDKDDDDVDDMDEYDVDDKDDDDVDDKDDDDVDDGVDTDVDDDIDDDAGDNIDDDDINDDVDDDIDGKVDDVDDEDEEDVDTANGSDVDDDCPI